jgi:hypothetical protein
MDVDDFHYSILTPAIGLLDGSTDAGARAIVIAMPTDFTRG